MGKKFDTFLKTIFIILEFICAVISAFIFVATITTAYMLIEAGITYVFILLCIASILSVINCLYLICKTISKSGENYKYEE